MGLVIPKMEQPISQNGATTPYSGIGYPSFGVRLVKRGSFRSFGGTFNETGPAGVFLCCHNSGLSSHGRAAVLSDRLPFAGGSRSQYPGIAVVLQNLFIFAGSLVYKFGRSEDLWG